MDLLPLISIPVIYLLVAIIKPYLQPSVSFNICAICIAVASTWLILLAMSLFGSDVSLITLSTLMGMSISGIMYKLETIFSENKLQNFWLVRIIIVLGGVYSIIALLNKQFNLASLIIIVSLIVIIILSFIFQKTVRDKSSFVKRLDDCC